MILHLKTSFRFGPRSTLNFIQVLKSHQLIGCVNMIAMTFALSNFSLKFLLLPLPLLNI